MIEYAARLSVNFLCAAMQPGLPLTNLAKKWSLKVDPGGERCLTVWIERESGMSSIRAVLLGRQFHKAGLTTWRCSISRFRDGKVPYH